MRWVGMVLLAGAVGAAEPEGLVGKREAGAIAGVVRQLARAGHAKPAQELQEWLRRAGAGETLRTNLAKECARALKRAKKKKPVPRGAAPSLRRVAAQLVKQLPELGTKDKSTLAGLILELDSSQAAAHKMLGRVDVEGRWLPAAVAPLLKRRREIAVALGKARAIEVKLEAQKSTALRRIEGPDGISVSWRKKLVLHAVDVPEGKLRRVMTGTLRAAAISNWLWTGRLELPATSRPLHVVLCGKVALFERWVRRAATDKKSGILLEHTKLGGFTWAGFEIYRPMTEAGWTSYTLEDYLYNRQNDVFGNWIQPALFAGHMHWLCLTFLGTPSPTHTYDSEAVKIREETRTGARNKITIERLRMMRMKEAGLTGLRAWMVYLAQRHRDPPWTKAMQDQMGKIDGDPLLKTTTVVEFLQEKGEFNTLAKKTMKAKGGPRERSPVFEQALGRTLAEFEREWRDWILPTRPGLVQRLGAPERPGLPRGIAPLLQHLDRKRQAAMLMGDAEDYVPLEYDADLSKGCVDHGRYLERNPAQQQVWPDVHEEFADKPGFSPRGSWAAQHAVIAFAIKDPNIAVDEWMATFYHRLPLLNPGLVRIGWGLHAGIAVLDSASLAGPWPRQTITVWPPPGARDVPRRFAPEIPNPVPGADQSRWGYPITLQTFGLAYPPDVKLGLFNGGKKVDCHYATPVKPTNPEIAPKGAYCLIPKRVLEAGTTYEVRAYNPILKENASWSFKTGK